MVNSPSQVIRSPLPAVYRPMNTVPGNSVITPTDLYVLLPLITKFLFIVKPAAPEKGIEKACREFLDAIVSNRTGDVEDMETFLRQQLLQHLTARSGGGPSSPASAPGEGKRRASATADLGPLHGYQPPNEELAGQLKRVLTAFSRECIRLRATDDIIGFAHLYFTAAAADTEGALDTLLAEQLEATTKRLASAPPAITRRRAGASRRTPSHHAASLQSVLSPKAAAGGGGSSGGDPRGSGSNKGGSGARGSMGGSGSARRASGPRAVGPGSREGSLAAANHGSATSGELTPIRPRAASSAAALTATALQ